MLGGVHRFASVVAITMVLGACAYGTIRDVPDEMIAQPEPDRDLVAAILVGDAVLADHLIATGADIERRGEGGMTPLIAAARTDANVLAARLLDMGARSDLRDGAGKNALAYALERDNEALVALLVDHAKRSY